MSSQLLVLIIVAGAVILAGLAWWAVRERRRRELRERFGSEYERTVSEKGAGAAETDLAARLQRVQQLAIRPVPAAQRPRFEEAWRLAQTPFVDDPAAAVAEADALVGEPLMAVCPRRYPVGDFEQRRGPTSPVNHPAVVEQYRAAHAIAVRERAGQATTEELRQAVVEYRALFSDLLATDDAASARAQPPGPKPRPDSPRQPRSRNERATDGPRDPRNADSRRSGGGRANDRRSTDRDG